MLQARVIERPFLPFFSLSRRYFITFLVGERIARYSSIWKSLMTLSLSILSSSHMFIQIQIGSYTFIWFLLQNRDSLFNSHPPLPYFIYDEPCNRDRFVARRDVFGQWVDVCEWFYLGPISCFWIMCRFGLWDWFFLFIPRTPSSPPSLPTPIVL